MSMDISQMAVPQAAPVGASKPSPDLAWLEKEAKKAATELGKATSLNAVYDKAAKALPQALGALDKARKDANTAVEQATQTYDNLSEEYDSAVAKRIQQIRKEVEQSIVKAGETVTAAEGALKNATSNVSATKLALDLSSAAFDDAQKALVGLAKQIQDSQAQVGRLVSASNDAHSKHQPVEAVVNLEDLAAEIAHLKKIADPKYEVGLWTNLQGASEDLVAKTAAFVDAQAIVVENQQVAAKAKDDLADKQKNRLDTIKKLLIDEQSSVAKPIMIQMA